MALTTQDRVTLDRLDAMAEELSNRGWAPDIGGRILVALAESGYFND